MQVKDGQLGLRQQWRAQRQMDLQSEAMEVND